jgi:hypothetical protein
VTGNRLQKRDVHRKQRLENKRAKRDNVYRFVVFANVDHNLKEEGRERDARSEAVVAENREERYYGEAATMLINLTRRTAWKRALWRQLKDQVNHGTLRKTTVAPTVVFR